MTIQQNYLMISTVTNIVENICVWDGDVNTWQPPADTLMLVQATTPAMVWVSDEAIPPVWTLTEQMGAGALGFTWDGTNCITNEPKPSPQTSADGQPVTTGTQVL